MNSRIHRPTRNWRRGLTLLEFVLALGLLVLVASMMFAFYYQIMVARSRGREMVSTGSLARIVAHQIAEEIRAANGFVPGIGPGVNGKERLITLQTVTMPDKELFRRRQMQDVVPPAESDIRQVSYYLAYDPDVNHTYGEGVDGPAPLGLVRREIRTLFQGTVFENQTQAVNIDRISHELKYLRFRYFDGLDWLSEWNIGNDVEGQLGNSLPQAVEITVGYAEVPPPDEEEEQQKKEEGFTESQLVPAEPDAYRPDAYRVVIKLPQADVFFGSRMMRAQRNARQQFTNGSGTGGAASR